MSRLSVDLLSRQGSPGWPLTTRSSSVPGRAHRSIIQLVGCILHPQRIVAEDEPFQQRAPRDLAGIGFEPEATLPQDDPRTIVKLCDDLLLHALLCLEP